MFDATEDSNVESVNTCTQDSKYSIKTTEAPLTLTSIETAISPPTQEVQKVQKEIPKPSDIDISKREPKIDPNMLDEVF